MMKLGDYVNLDNLQKLIADGYINERRHPTLPLRILNYSNACQFDQKWPVEVCASRGLIVDDEDNIVSRAQFKFFNLGQNSTILNGNGYAEENVMVDESYLYDVARFSKQPLTITRKMDGQQGETFNYNGQWGISTRGSFESDGAKFGTDKFQKFVKYGAVEFIPKGWTLIWELIDEKLRIVIPYQWSGLCLLTAVNNETGEEMSYDELHELWVKLNSYSKTLDKDGNSVQGKPWCRIVERVDINLEAAKLDPSVDEEGYVAAINRRGLPPIKAKIKLATYLALHKRLTGTTPQMIWNEMAHPVDTFLTTESRFNRVTKEISSGIPTPHEFAEWVRQWQRGLTKAFHENLVKAIKAVEALRIWESGLVSVPKFKNDSERKGWLTTQGYDSDTVSAAMLLYKGREAEAYEGLWKLVRPLGRDDRFYVEGKGE